MKIYWSLAPDGQHIRASAQQPNHRELTPDQRHLLCQVFQELCDQKEAGSNLALQPPKHVGKYVLIRVGHDNGECFAEYADPTPATA